MLVKDAFTKWPSLFKILYCNLDYDILILNIMLFNMWMVISGSSIISIFIVYFIEKFLEKLRTELATPGSYYAGSRLWPCVWKGIAPTPPPLAIGFPRCQRWNGSTIPACHPTPATTSPAGK